MPRRTSRRTSRPTSRVVSAPAAAFALVVLAACAPSAEEVAAGRSEAERYLASVGGPGTAWERTLDAVAGGAGADNGSGVAVVETSADSGDRWRAGVAFIAVLPDSGSEQASAVTRACEEAAGWLVQVADTLPGNGLENAPEVESAADVVVDCRNAVTSAGDGDVHDFASTATTASDAMRFAAYLSVVGGGGNAGAQLYAIAMANEDLD